jgi:hypothetical protein
MSGEGITLCREVWMVIPQQEVTGAWNVRRESDRQAFSWAWSKGETGSLLQTSGQIIRIITKFILKDSLCHHRYINN